MIGAEVSQKLAKLVPMLGSDIEAEALGAVRAIGRVLAAAGSDWHDLAQSLIKPTFEETIVAWAKGDARRAPRQPQHAAEPERPPFRNASSYDTTILNLNTTFARTFDTKQARCMILDMLSIEGAPIKPDEFTYLQLIADECYRQPHARLGAAVDRRLDGIRRRVLKFLYGKLEATA